MARGSFRLAVWAVAALLISAAGCRDREPDERFSTNLARVEGEWLLPAQGGVHSAQDMSILQGSTQADIVKLGDREAAAAATPIQPETTNIEQATGGVGDALASVGRAFLDNIRQGGEPAAQPGDETAPPTDAAPAAPAEADAIRAVFAEYNATRAEDDTAALQRLCVSRQEDTARLFYEVRDVAVGATIKDFLTAYEKIAPGAQAKFDAIELPTKTALELSDLRLTGPDTATGTITGPEPIGERSITFERQDGAWRIVDPFVPSEANWANVETSFDDIIDDLYGLTDKVAEPGADPDAIWSEFTAILDRLFRLVVSG